MVVLVLIKGDKILNHVKMLFYKSWASFEPFYVISNAHNVDNVFKISTVICSTRKT
jgi:hypothetical protein